MKRWVATLCLALIATAAQANSMRCGNRLVTPGDTKSSVLNKCGEPSFRDVVGIERTRDRSTSTSVIVEEWSYSQGQGRLQKTVVFHGNRVVRIRSGSRE